MGRQQEMAREGGTLLEGLPRFLTVAEAAEVLRVAPGTIYAECKDGTLRCVNFGRAIRIPRVELETRLARLP
jgi:excisionase family DNA binding protein